MDSNPVRQSSAALFPCRFQHPPREEMDRKREEAAAKRRGAGNARGRNRDVRATPAFTCLSRGSFYIKSFIKYMVKVSLGRSKG